LSEELEWLRSAINGLDSSLLEIIAARLRLARAVSRVKRSRGLPVYDPGREEEHLARLMGIARGLGLGEELVTDLYSLLLRASRCEQLYCPERLRVLIYGYGGMARTLASSLLRAGCWVAISGRDEEKARSVAESLGAAYMEPCRGVDWADMVVYATPGHVVPELLRRHLPCMRQSMLVTDIASVKTRLVREIGEILGGAEEPPEYASLHPLFGPTECPAGETITVTPVRLSNWAGRLTRLLEALGLKPVTIDAETHDKVMAVNQVLHHLVHEIYREARRELAQSLGLDQELLAMLETRSQRQTNSINKRLESLGKVVEEIRSQNPYSNKVVQVLGDIVARYRSAH